MYQLVWLLVQGLNAPSDRERAHALFTTAADQGLATAYLGLYVTAEERLGGPSDDNLSWMRRAGAADLPQAQLQIGLAYAFGLDDVAIDVKEGVTWLERAAQHDHPIAQYYLARLYIEGKAAAPDGNAGIRLLQEAAAAEFEPADDALYWLEELGQRGQRGAQANTWSLALLPALFF
jgi:TPR repeat protein